MKKVIIPTLILNSLIPTTSFSASSYQCLSCPIGTYSTAGSEGRSSCKNCPVGYSCIGGEDKKPCPAGTYAAAGSSQCTKCPAGYYCPGGTDKKICAAGTYSKAGATKCSSCANNTYAKAGASSCTPCLSRIPGKYNDGEGHWKSCFAITSYGTFKPSEKDTYITTNQGLAMISGRYMTINVSCEKTTGNITLTGTGRYMKSVKLVMTPNKEVITYEGDTYLNSHDPNGCN